MSADLISNLGFDLVAKSTDLRNILANGDNLVLSPVSAFMAGAAAAYGAAGATLTNLLNVLGVYRKDDLDTSIGEAKRILFSSNRVSSLDSANAVFSDLLTQSYADEVYNVLGEVVRKQEPTELAMDSYVRDKTEGRVDNIIDHAIDLGSIALVNALFFKAQWLTRFDRADTVKANFYPQSRSDVGSVQLVDMMKARSDEVADGLYKFWYRETDEVQAVNLMYDPENTFDAIIVLPKDRNEPLANLMTRSKWEDLTSVSFVKRAGRVRVPRFELYEPTLNLTESFSDLGVYMNFDRPAGDLSPMSLNDHAYISSILQRTYIKIDEDGVRDGPISTSDSSNDAFNFVADHPFIFIIRDKPTNTVVLMAAVHQPVASGIPSSFIDTETTPEYIVDNGDAADRYCRRVCDSVNECRNNPADQGTYCKDWQSVPVCFGLYHKNGGFCFQPNDKDCDDTLLQPVLCGQGIDFQFSSEFSTEYVSAYESVFSTSNDFVVNSGDVITPETPYLRRMLRTGA